MEEQNKKMSEEQQGEQQQRKHSSGNAANIDAIINSPTEAVRSRHTTGANYANTGTNISYEGATAPGSGGSAGTGQASGQDATGARISAEDENDHLHNHTNHKDQDVPQDDNSPFIGTKPDEAKGDEPMTDDEADDADETDDTMGNP